MPLSDFYPGMDGWKPVTEPSVPKAPQIPDQTTQINPFLRTTMPLTLQYQPDTLRQFNRPGVSGYRAAPLAPSANAGINSTAAGVATTISTTIVNDAIANIPAPVADVESIGINKQTGTSYTLQPSDLDTLVTFDNNSGGAITLPSPSGTSTAGSTAGGQVDGSISQATFSAAVSLTLATGTTSDYAITAFTGQNVGGGVALGTPSGWTGLSGGGVVTFVGKQQSGGAPITLNATPGAQTWSAAMAAFRSTGTVTATNRGGGGGVLSNGFTTTVASLTAGNYIVVMLAGDGIENGPLSLGITDTQGNVYKTAASAENSYPWQGGTRTQHVKILSAKIGSSGSDTLTFSIAAGTGTTVGANFAVYELSGFMATGPVSSLPPNWFTYLENTSSGTFGVGSLSTIDEITQIVQLPPNTGMLVVYDGTNYYTVRGINKKLTFADISGILPVGAGGSGANLSATGGTNQLVRQNSAGGNFDVVQPDWNFMLGAAGAKATAYNGLTLLANGIPVIFQLQNRPGSNANLAPANFAAIPAGGGFVRVSVYAIVTTPGTVSSTLPDSQIIYTDLDNNVSITVPVTAGSTGNTTSTFVQNSAVFSVRGSTLMQFAIGQVTPYATSGATSMVFSYRCRVEFIG